MLVAEDPANGVVDVLLELASTAEVAYGVQSQTEVVGGLEGVGVLVAEKRATGVVVSLLKLTCSLVTTIGLVVDAKEVQERACGVVQLDVWGVGKEMTRMLGGQHAIPG